MGWDWLRKAGNWITPGDPFGKDGPDQSVIDNYNAGQYNGQQGVGGYAPGTGMPGMTDPSGMMGGQAYNPYSGSGLTLGMPGTGSPYGTPSNVSSMAGMGLDYGTGSLADTMDQYQSANAKTPDGWGNQQGGGGFWGDMSGAEKAALITSGIGALGGIYGSWKQGKAQDEDRQRAQDEHDRQLREREEAAAAMAPLVAKYLGKYGKTEAKTGG